MFIEVYLLMQVALIPVIIREFQLSLLEASLIATIPSLLTLLMNIPSGFLTDKFSTNQLLFISMLVEGLSTFLVSQTSNFWMLIVGVSLLKFLLQYIISLDSANLADSQNPKGLVDT